jgi:hypothetical protein
VFHFVLEASAVRTIKDQRLRLRLQVAAREYEPSQVVRKARIFFLVQLTPQPSSNQCSYLGEVLASKKHVGVPSFGVSLKKLKNIPNILV